MHTHRLIWVQSIFIIINVFICSECCFFSINCTYDGGLLEMYEASNYVIAFDESELVFAQDSAGF